MNREELLKKYQHLFWYFDKTKLNTISDTVIVEFILNYGDIAALHDLFETLGIKNAAKEFAHSIENKRNNYPPIVTNFFNLYFSKNVPEYPFK